MAPSNMSIQTGGSSEPDMQQSSHPEHNMPPTTKYSHDTLSTTQGQRDIKFEYDEPYQSNQNLGLRGPTNENAMNKEQRGF